MTGFGKKSIGRRAFDRGAAPLPCFFTTRGRSAEVVLLDLSCKGARVRGEELPAMGEELVLAAGELRVFGRIAWSSSGQCGVTFDMALPQDLVAEIRGQAAERSDLAPEVVAAMDDWLTGFAR
jgi:hypothetical protein